MKLSVNRLIRWIGDADDQESARVERIVFIDETGSDLATLDLKKKRSKPIWHKSKEIKSALERGEARLMEDDSYAPLALTASDLEETKYRKIKKIRDQRWDVIAPLVTGENVFKILFAHERATLIEERTKVMFAHGKGGKNITYSRQSIYRFLYLWWHGGQVKNALLGRYLNSGALGTARVQKAKIGRPSKITTDTDQAVGVVLTSYWLEIICWGALLFYNNNKVKDIQAAYRKTLRHFCVKREKLNEQGEQEFTLLDYTKGEVFTPFQFKYQVLKKIDGNLQEFFRKKYGQRKFDLRYRSLKGNSTQLAPYPGALYQIDATIADVYLVSRLNKRHIIGRPVIVVIIDVFSRMIVGVSVRMEREGWNVIGLALKNATEDKVNYCEKYGIEIKSEAWPVLGLCDALTGDRGPMIGYNADNLADGLNIAVSNLPPYRPDWKGIVEQVFHLMNIRVIRDLPGALNPEAERGDRDVRLDAQLDINQFTAIIIKAILYHNNDHYMETYPFDKDMIASDLKPIAREIFLWGRKNKSGSPRTREAEAIRVNLLPGATAKITKRGIKFRNEYYTCPKMEEENWRFRARNKGEWSEKIAYDPRVPEIIYLRPIDGSPSIACYLLDKDSIAVGSDMAEIEEYYERKSIEDLKGRANNILERSRLDDAVDHIIKPPEEIAAEVLASPSIESDRSRLNRIKEHRHTEIELMDEEYRQEILEQSGLHDSTEGLYGAANRLSDSDEEYVQRPQFSNVLSIQERLMKTHDET